MLDFLKAQTQEVHKGVEGSNLAKHILDHSITASGYKDLLLQNYYCYHSIEQELFNKKDLVQNELLPFISIDKSKKLLKDIKLIDPLFNDYINFNEDYSLNSELEIIGALYVVEGSMLGGLLINKHITKCEHLSTIENHHFFGVNPKTVINRWNAFKSSINKTSFSDHEKEKALVSAIRTFKIFGTNYSLLSNNN